MSHSGVLTSWKEQQQKKRSFQLQESQEFFWKQFSNPRWVQTRMSCVLIQKSVPSATCMVQTGGPGLVSESRFPSLFLPVTWDCVRAAARPQRAWTWTQQSDILARFFTQKRLVGVSFQATNCPVGASFSRIFFDRSRNPDCGVTEGQGGSFHAVTDLGADLHWK